MKYLITIDRVGDTWNIHVPDLDLRTTCGDSKQIPDVGRDLIAGHLEVERDSFEIAVMPVGATKYQKTATMLRGRPPTR